LLPSFPDLGSLARHCRVCTPARRGVRRGVVWLGDAAMAVHRFTSRRFVTTVAALTVLTALASLFA
jgi:hypothetical protein